MFEGNKKQINVRIITSENKQIFPPPNKNDISNYGASRWISDSSIKDPHTTHNRSLCQGVFSVCQLQWVTSFFGLIFRWDHWWVQNMAETEDQRMLSEVQNSKYKVNILQVKQKSTIQVLSVAILAPVFTQLIWTSDWDQNSGVRLVFGLSERLIQKVKSSNGTDNQAHNEQKTCKNHMFMTDELAVLNTKYAKQIKA